MVPLKRRVLSLQLRFANAKIERTLSASLPIRNVRFLRRRLQQLRRVRPLREVHPRRVYAGFVLVPPAPVRFRSERHHDRGGPLPPLPASAGRWFLRRSHGKRRGGVQYLSDVPRRCWPASQRSAQRSPRGKAVDWAERALPKRRACISSAGSSDGVSTLFSIARRDIAPPCDRPHGISRIDHASSARMVQWPDRVLPTIHLCHGIDNLCIFRSL